MLSVFLNTLRTRLKINARRETVLTASHHLAFRGKRLPIFQTFHESFRYGLRRFRERDWFLLLFLVEVNCAFDLPVKWPDWGHCIEGRINRRANH